MDANEVAEQYAGRVAKVVSDLWQSGMFQPLQMSKIALSVQSALIAAAAVTNTREQVDGRAKALADIAGSMAEQEMRAQHQAQQERRDMLDQALSRIEDGR